MLFVVKLSVIMLSVIMANVVRLCVAGPIAEGHGATPLRIIALGLTTLSIMSLCII